MRRVIPIEILVDNGLKRVISAQIGEVQITPTDYLGSERTEGIITNILIARKLGWEVITRKIKGDPEYKGRSHSFVRSPEGSQRTGWHYSSPVSEYDAFLLLGGKRWSGWHIQEWAGDMDMILPLAMEKYPVSITAKEGVYHLTLGEMVYSETTWLNVPLRLSQMYVQQEGLILDTPSRE